MLSYFWAKFLKIARASAIRATDIHPSSRIHSGSSAVSCRIDRHSFAGYDCQLFNVDIGPFCSLGSRITIGGVAHPSHFVSTSPAFLSHKDSIKAKFACHAFLPELRTVVGADVWVGDGAFIKAGVQVGHGAVIGMGAVVTRDVPPYGIVAGNPARLIRYRFEPSIIQGLLDTSWWTWPDAHLTEYGPFMANPQEFLAKWRGT
jgi:acetyltransferase-like isoleucine patch superfamily enzyme